MQLRRWEVCLPFVWPEIHCRVVGSGHLVLTAGKRSISAKEMAEYLAEQEAEGGHQDNTAEAVMSPSRCGH